MPKRVDHEERRQLIAAALLRLLSRDGLEAASLRHVAAEAGVTAGMVQHYFPSKDAMLQYAMGVASARYEQRIVERLSALGADAAPSATIGVLVGSLIPATAAEAEDARIALAFQSYAAHHEDATRRLSEGNRMLAEHIGQLLTAIGAGGEDPVLTATGLIAIGEGLALATLSADLPPADAQRALELHIALTTR